MLNNVVSETTANILTATFLAIVAYLWKKHVNNLWLTQILAPFKNIHISWLIKSYVGNYIIYKLKEIFAATGLSVSVAVMAIAFLDLPATVSMGSRIVLLVACLMAAYQIQRISVDMAKVNKQKKKALQSFLESLYGQHGIDPNEVKSYSIYQLFRDEFYEKRELELAEWERRNTS